MPTAKYKVVPANRNETVPIIFVILFDTFPESDRNNKIEVRKIMNDAKMNAEGCSSVKLTIISAIPTIENSTGMEYFLTSIVIFSIIKRVFLTNTNLQY